MELPIETDVHDQKFKSEMIIKFGLLNRPISSCINLT